MPRSNPDLYYLFREQIGINTGGRETHRTVNERLSRAEGQVVRFGTKQDGACWQSGSGLRPPPNGRRGHGVFLDGSGGNRTAAFGNGDRLRAAQPEAAQLGRTSTAKAGGGAALSKRAAS